MSYALREVIAPEPPDDGDVCYLEDRGCACTPSTQGRELGPIALLLLGWVASGGARRSTRRR
jgi:hypothetical protein